jgi:hypothetical protein
MGQYGKVSLFGGRLPPQAARFRDAGLPCRSLDRTIYLRWFRT